MQLANLIAPSFRFGIVSARQDDGLLNERKGRMVA